MITHEFAVLPYQTHQIAFTDWLRHPESCAMPTGIEARRMRVYRNLVYSNITSFLEHSYPITQAMLPQAEWTALVDLFFTSGQCDSPYYYDIATHFRDFIETHAQACTQLYPWLRELLQYEWMGQYIDRCDSTWAAPATAQNTESDTMLALRTQCWVLGYQYPVHRWTVDDHPAVPAQEPTCLLIYRTAEFEPRVYPMHPLWAYLLELWTSDGTMTQQRLTDALLGASPLSAQAAAQTVQALFEWLQQIGLVGYVKTAQRPHK